MLKYIRAFKNGFHEENFFKINFFMSFLCIPIQLAIIYYFWITAINGKTIAGYTGNTIVAYFLATYLLQTCISPALYVAYNLFDGINTGKIIPWILKPISYPLMTFSKNLSLYLLKFLISFMLFLAIPFFWHNSLVSYSVGILSAFLGYVILFELQFLIGSLTLKLKNILTFRDNLMDALMLLGGFIVPIEFMPNFLQQIAKWTPLPYVIYLPAKILSTGNITPVIIQQLWIQISWVLVLLITIKIVWKLFVVDTMEQGG